MPNVMTEQGSIELPYDVENPDRLKAAVEMLMEELPDEMKGDFVAFWQSAGEPMDVDMEEMPPMDAEVPGEAFQV
tara:strand:- start:369 stop:593 length:225 start_codon:yes stop_codon:yes gene_type:complete